MLFLWLRGVHHTAESGDEKFSKNSAVCISLRSQAPQYASYLGVWLCGVHYTAESITCQVSVLIWSFTNATSLWCLKIFIRNWYCKSQIVQGIFFTSKFFEKMKLKDVASTKTRKTDIFKSARLHGVLPNSESDSAVCITPRSQAPQCASLRRVKMHTG